MNLNKNPYFRKVATPWYDSNLVCWVLLTGMCLIFFFGVTGIIVASTTPEFKRHIWLPLFLTGASFFLAVKLFLRIQKKSGDE